MRPAVLALSAALLASAAAFSFGGKSFHRRLDTASCEQAVMTSASCMQSYGTAGQQAAFANCCWNVDNLVAQCGSGDVLNAASAIVGLAGANYNQFGQDVSAAMSIIGQCTRTNTSAAGCSAVLTAANGACPGPNCCAIVSNEVVPQCLGTPGSNNQNNNPVDAVLMRAVAAGCQVFPSDLCTNAANYLIACVNSGGTNPTQCCAPGSMEDEFCTNWNLTALGRPLPSNVEDILPQLNATCNANNNGGGCPPGIPNFAWYGPENVAITSNLQIASGPVLFTDGQGTQWYHVNFGVAPGAMVLRPQSCGGPSGNATA